MSSARARARLSARRRERNGGAEREPCAGTFGGRAQAGAALGTVGVEQDAHELGLARAEHRLVERGARERLVHLAGADEERDGRRELHAGGRGGRLKTSCGGCGLAQQQAHELAAPGLRGAGAV